MWSVVVGALLLVHAFINGAIWASPAPKSSNSPFDATHSWMVGDARVLAAILAVAAAAALGAAGIGVFVHAGWWRPSAMVGAGFSLVLVVVFFNAWLLGAAIANLGIIVALGWAHWPTARLIGA